MTKSETPDPVVAQAADLLARQGGEGIVLVRGDSMLPTLRSGSATRVRFGKSAPTIGDLLVFRQADYLAVHRYLGPARRPDGAPCLRTRGDGRPALDPPLDTRDVVGCVLAIERPDGWRSVTGVRGRGYAVLLALHDLAWSALFVVASRMDARTGIVTAPHVARWDLRLLRAADGLLFRLLHRRAEPPRQTGL